VREVGSGDKGPKAGDEGVAGNIRDGGAGNKGLQQGRHRIAICSHMRHRSGSLATIGGTPRYPSSSSRSSAEVDSWRSHDMSLIEFSSCIHVFLNAVASREKKKSERAAALRELID
jgi:hypothetical protein